MTQEIVLAEMWGLIGYVLFGLVAIAAWTERIAEIRYGQVIGRTEKMVVSVIAVAYMLPLLAYIYTKLQ